MVKTAEGKVRGLTENGVNIFKGIPYAAPPVGKLRWMPPQPVKRWKGQLDATHYANTCPQVTTLGAFAGPTSANEDCLYLNVFATNKNNNKKKPVIVWIHGGGNVDGESNDYDGSKLATGGPDGTPTVVVTLNYRLGLFGTFSHPAINKEGHLWGNYGTLDQQAVLRWVQRNISAFGGDPTRVAVGGQSAGAYNTGVNFLSPLSNGLFNRAIFQSSPGFFSTLPTAADALTRGKNFAKAAACPTGSGAKAADCLRNLSAARILQLQGTPNADGPYTTGTPFVDGTIIPITPEKAWATGRFNKMPVMGGATKDEMTFLTGISEYFATPQAPMTADQYAAAVTQGAPCAFCTGGAMPAGVADQYPLSTYNNDPMIAYERVVTDTAKCKEVHVLQKLAPLVPTYAYDFTYPNAPYYFPKMPGFKALASHTIDIQFLFNNWHGGNIGVNLDQETGQPRELNEKETKLSDQLVAAWTNFAKNGNPNGSGNSPWPKFDAGQNAKYFVQDVPLSTTPVSQFRSVYKCDFWDTVASY
ncbi:carboxylesterase family protein [Hyphomicrobium sp. B1]|uniref:carboxylesterase/lipase family protein n=1 Tax=unclassified Hyphomicrobium TaxID=2619925 RepID=UPI0039C05D93